MKNMFRSCALLALLLLASSVAMAEDITFAPGPEGEMQRIEFAFFDAMNKAGTTQEMLNAATVRYNALSALLNKIRPQALRPVADDPAAANAFQEIDGSFAKLTQSVMDMETRKDGTLAPVSASIAGGNIMSAQLSLYLGLASGVETESTTETFQSGPVPR